MLTRILCVDDRRGIYTELTGAGQDLLDQATPIHAATLERVLMEAQESADLIPLVNALQRLPESERQA